MANATVTYDEKILNQEIIEKYTNISDSKIRDSFANIQTGMGEEVDEISKISQPEKIRISADKTKSEKLFFNFIIFTVLAIILMYIAMGHMINLPIISFLDPHHNPINYTVSLLILTIAFLIYGFDILKNGYKNLIHKIPNMDTLVSIGVISSFIYSLYGMYMVIRGNSHFTMNLYFESSAIIIYFVKLGRYIDGISKDKTKEAIQKLTQITPNQAIIEVDGVQKQVTLDEIKKGDIVISKAGDKIAVDGEIIEGSTHLDESFITGESKPVAKAKGEKVIAGSLNFDGFIKYKAERIGKESTVSEIVKLVIEASNTKVPIAKIADKISGIFVPSVIVIAILTFIAYLILGYEIGTALSTFITILVVACPCSLGLATPLAIVVSEGVCAENGILVKKSEILENASKIDTIVFDKTGTITIGNRKATRFYPAQGVDEHAFIEACLLSSVSDDTPEGKSIIELGRESGLRMRNLNTDGAHMIKFTAETKCSGINLKDGTEIRKGAFDAIRKIALSAGNPFPKETEDIIQTITSNGGTPLVVSVNKKIAGVIELQDIIKPGIQERFERLRKMGVKTVMVTGDNPLTAKYIAEKAGVDDFIAEAKPEDKMEYIKKEQAAGKLVAMMGDGTNDAPALAQANVGVAMNSGTQAAKEAGNMVDLDNDPTKLIEIVEIGKQLLMTRGTLTTFSIANDVAKYFAIVPALFMLSIPELAALNIMGLHSPESAILSAVIFNAIIIPILIPLALKGVQYKPIGASALLRRNLLIYGIGGVIAPFVGIKLIDLVVGLFF